MADGCFKALPTDDTEVDIASDGVEAALIPTNKIIDCEESVWY